MLAFLLTFACLMAALPAHALTVKQRVTRFLTQATFGPKDSEVTALTNAVNAKIAAGQSTENALKNACGEWIDAQIALPRTPLGSLVDVTIPYSELGQLGGIRRPESSIVERALMQRMMTAPDQLRHRLTVALSEIFVVSDKVNSIDLRPAGLAHFYDTLLNRSFGYFHNALQDVSLHPIMGIYLSHAGNGKATATTFPDENYAREVMQLFSCGLYHLQDNGDYVTDASNNVIPTYDNDDIVQMAKVFTGLSYHDRENFNSGPSSIQSTLAPMKGFDSYHDFTRKTLLALIPGANPKQTPESYMTDEPNVDDSVREVKWVCRNVLAEHASTPPFIARQLIQRFVTSNPTSAYIGRVVAVWKDDGSSNSFRRGNLAAVIKAILLDNEALRETNLTDSEHGKLREPVFMATHIHRAFGASAVTTPFEDGTVTRTPFPGVTYWPALRSISTEDLGQQIFSSPSVFNFFLPEHSPNGPLREAGLTGPEFQIFTDSTLPTILNYAFTRGDATKPHDFALGNIFTRYYNPSNPSVPLPSPTYAHGNPAYNRAVYDFTTELAFLPATGTPTTTQADNLIAHLNDKLCYGMLSAENQSLIRTAITTTRSAYTREQRLRDAIFLIMSCPDYLIQK